MPRTERAALLRPRQPTRPVHLARLPKRVLPGPSRTRCDLDSRWQARRFSGLWTNKPANLGILDEVEDACERWVGCTAATDVDDGGVLQILGKDLERASARLAVDRVEHLVDHHPARVVDQQTCEHETLLFIPVQFGVPSRGAIEHRSQTSQAHPIERLGERMRLEPFDALRIGQYLAQSAGRQVWLA